MRMMMLSLFSIVAISCDPPVDETTLDELEVIDEEIQDEEIQSEHEDDTQIPAAIGDVLKSGGNQNGSCSCYTTCSSNPGLGWTKTYYVGSASGQSNCSDKAASFCKGKSSSYKYHNSACT